jgi:hypothetical protein
MPPARRRFNLFHTEVTGWLRQPTPAGELKRYPHMYAVLNFWLPAAPALAALLVALSHGILACSASRSQ